MIRGDPIRIALFYCELVLILSEILIEKAQKCLQTRHEKMQKCLQTRPKNMGILHRIGAFYMQKLHPIGYNLMQNGPFCTLSVIKLYTRTAIMLSFSIRIASFRQYLSKLFRTNEYIFCRFDADFCGVQVSVDVNRDVNRDVIMDVIMDVTDRFKPSYSTIFTLFDAITRKRQHDGAHLDRRKRYIQSGYRAENKTFGTDFPRLEPKQPKQNSGIISNKSEPQKGNLTGAEQYCSERDGKHESDLNRRNAERQKNRRKAQKGSLGRYPPPRLYLE